MTRRGKRMSKQHYAKLRVIWDSPEYKEKHRTRMTGTKHSEETKRKIRLGNIGKVRTKKFRKNLSRIMKRRWSEIRKAS